ncbi:MAG: drug:proton antiporter, partial [Actinomycetota bacterium]
MNTEPTHTVVFTPSGRSGQVASGTTVLAAARSLGADIDSVCGGRGICGRCQIDPVPGEHAKWGLTTGAEHLSAPGSTEEAYRGRRPLEGRRLGCAARIEGDVVVDVPAESQLHRPVVRKEIHLDDLVLDPAVTLHYLPLPPRDDDDGTDALTIITDELAAVWNRPGVGAEPQVLAHLVTAVEAGAVTVALRDDAIAGVWPGFVDRVLGVAVDIGSTTVAGHLCDLTTGEVVASAGRMNPQIRFGEDLMSRVSYAMLNDGGAEQLTAAVRQAIG